jgi:predicted alternative tryptophan synthase beta-subunit
MGYEALLLIKGLGDFCNADQDGRVVTQRRFANENNYYPSPKSLHMVAAIVDFPLPTTALRKTMLLLSKASTISSITLCCFLPLE